MKPNSVWWIGAGLAVTWATAAGLAYLLFAPRFALDACKSRLKAGGARLALQDFDAPGVAEHQAAARRLFAAARTLPRTGTILSTHAPVAMHLVGPGRARVAWQQPMPDMPRPEFGAARRAQRPGSAPIAPSPQPTPEATWEDLAAELETIRPALAQIRHACQAESLDWGIDFANGFETLLPYLAPCKAAVQRLQAAMLLALRENRLDDALDLLDSQLRLARNLNRNGVVIDELVRIAIGSIAFNSTWELLQAEGWTDPQLQRVASAWQQTPFLQSMLRGLQMERAVTIRECALLRQSPSRLATLTARLGSGPSASSDSNSLIGTITEGLRRLTGSAGATAPARWWAWFRSWDDERCALESFEGILQAAATRLQLANASPRLWPLRPPNGQAFVPSDTLSHNAPNRHLVASQPIGSLPGATAKAFRAEMLREMALTAIALQRYRLRRGAFPDALDRLVPEFLPDLPLDWFDGRPLRYRRIAPDRFLLYSVNQDGEDDGGDPKPALTAVAARSFSPQNARDFVWPDAARLENEAR
jgi:hypothetical protein